MFYQNPRKGFFKMAAGNCKTAFKKNHSKRLKSSLFGAVNAICHIFSPKNIIFAAIYINFSRKFFKMATVKKCLKILFF